MSINCFKKYATRTRLLSTLVCRSRTPNRYCGKCVNDQDYTLRMKCYGGKPVVKNMTGYGLCIGMPMFIALPDLKNNQPATDPYLKRWNHCTKQLHSIIRNFCNTL